MWTASGRFPGVFAPMPVDIIYPLESPDNSPLKSMLNDWLNDQVLEAQMTSAYRALSSDQEVDLESWERIFASWRDSDSMREFFPQASDAYLDGGAIDNTPSNSAIDATREWIAKEGVSKRDMQLDLFVVFLHPEPRVTPDKAQDPALYQVVGRTLDIQGAAKQSSDAVVVDTINHFGRLGEELGDSLLLLVESYLETLDGLGEDQKREVETRLREAVAAHGLRGYRGRRGEGILGRMQGWGERMLGERLPLQVEMVKIHPEEMPLSTLQFTERLGYRQENALKMLALGCSDTLWTLREHLEKQTGELDEQDNRSLALARKWMGNQDWPQGDEAQEELRGSWRCQRTACVFHAQHCGHGAGRAS